MEAGNPIRKRAERSREGRVRAWKEDGEDGLGLGITSGELRRSRGEAGGRESPQGGEHERRWLGAGGREHSSVGDRRVSGACRHFAGDGFAVGRRVLGFKGELGVGQ